MLCAYQDSPGHDAVDAERAIMPAVGGCVFTDIRVDTWAIVGYRAGARSSIDIFPTAWRNRAELQFRGYP